MSLVIGATGPPAPPVLSSTTDDAINGNAFQGSGAGASALYPTASMALFMPFRLAEAHTYVKAWWLNGSAVAGQVDVGIYTLSGTTLTRVVASTAENQATTSVMQVAATFTTTTIGPGAYYLAISCTNAATAQFWRMALSINMGRALGCFQAATSSPLPSSCTSAVWNSGSMPIFGLSELSTI